MRCVLLRRRAGTPHQQLEDRVSRHCRRRRHPVLRHNAVVLLLRIHAEDSDPNIVFLDEPELLRRNTGDIATGSHRSRDDSRVTNLHLHHAAHHAERLADDLLEGRQRHFADFALLRLHLAHRVGGKVDQHVFAAAISRPDVNRSASISVARHVAVPVAIQINPELPAIPRDSTRRHVAVVIGARELVVSCGHGLRRERRAGVWCCGPRLCAGGGDGHQQRDGRYNGRMGTTHGVPPQARNDGGDTTVAPARFRRVARAAIDSARTRSSAAPASGPSCRQPQPAGSASAAGPHAPTGRTHHGCSSAP